jgi:predicted amidohydrolase
MNSVVGDFKHNADRIESCLEEATKFGADLVLFPELALTGYPPEDLLLKNDFIEKNKKILNYLASGVKGVVAVIGYVEKIKMDLYNSAALVYEGKVIGNYRKMILPNYGVFDEKRYFMEGRKPACFILNVLADCQTYRHAIQYKASRFTAFHKIPFLVKDSIVWKNHFSVVSNHLSLIDQRSRII